MLLEAWRAAEAQAESVSADACAAAVQAVEKRMPKRIKRKVQRCCQLTFAASQACKSCSPVMPLTLWHAFSYERAHCQRAHLCAWMLVQTHIA